MEKRHQPQPQSKLRQMMDDDWSCNTNANTNANANTNKIANNCFWNKIHKWIKKIKTKFLLKKKKPKYTRIEQ